MKRLVLFSLVFICCLPFVYGTQRTVAANWNVAFCEPYPATANDFHINLDPLSANNKIPLLCNHWAYDLSGLTQWYMNAITLSQSTTDPTIWHGYLDFKTTGGYISTGDIVHFGVTFKTENYRSIRPRMAWWTLDGVHISNAHLVGFHVWELYPFYPISTLFNDTAAELTIEQLEFAVTPTQVPLEDMFSTGLGDPGKSGSYQDVKWVSNGPIPIKIQPGKSFDVDLKAIGVTINKDEFLQFRAFVNGVPQWWQSQQ